MSSKTKTTATKEEATRGLVPKLRFPEFRDGEGWKSKTLGQMGTFIRGLTYTPGDVADKGLLVLRSGNIQDGSLVFDKDLVFVEKGCAPDLLLRGGDVVICMSNGSKALVGKSGEYRQDYSGEVTIGAFCSLFRPKNPFSKIAFRSEQYSDFVADSIMGGNINNLKNSTLEGFPFPVPPSAPEQQKIAECLSSVDELIAAQARKLDALKTHKKGLMQQLFPREGETQPRLRFPEFQNAGEWDVTTIGDLKPFVTSGSRGWAPFYAEKGELFVRITNLWRSSIYLDLTDSKFVQLPPGANEGVRTQLKEHDVLISITADIGIIGYVDETVPSPAYINQHIALVRFDAGQLCGKYIAYFFASEKSQRLFGASTDTGTKAGMSLIGIQKIELMLPGLPEQQRIADCLTSLDDLIAAQTQKLEALKTHKKGLMQQLFPSPEEVEA